MDGPSVRGNVTFKQYNVNGSSYFPWNATEATLGERIVAALPLHNGDRAAVERACWLQNQEPWVQEAIQAGETCGGVWDGWNCWPPTDAGLIVYESCSRANIEVLANTHVELPGHVFRVCTLNGTWLRGNYSDYSQCIASVKEWHKSHIAGKVEIQTAARYIVLIGSIISLLFLFMTVLLFHRVPTVRSERAALLRQIIMALILKTFLLLLTVAPSRVSSQLDWNHTGWVCNAFVSFQQYTNLALHFLILAHGYSLHHLLAQDTQNGHIPMDRVKLFCWGSPVLIASAWFTLMSFERGNPSCWAQVDSTWLLWIITFPLLVTVLTHLMYIFRIFFTLISTIGLVHVEHRQRHKWNATKITITLFLMLGLNNIFFFVKPTGSKGEMYYLIGQSLFQSGQGTIISIICCFLTRDIRKKIKNYIAQMIYCLED